MAIGPTKPATPEAKDESRDRVSSFESAQTQHPDSSRTVDDLRMEPGAVVADRYRIVRVIGEGGMGVVYAAEHVLMRKEVALKVLHADMCTNPEIVARFEREAIAAAHIDHPHIAGATDFGRLDDGACYLVLELLRGPSLREELDKGPIPFGRAVRILRGITSGISAAHAKGVIHRDLKPENIMLVERDGDFDFVKILDFGIAKLDPSVEAGPSAGKVLTRLGTVFGTPEYMAPEQAVGDVVDARADLYALGVIFLEMLTGKCPFEGDPMAILRARIVATEPPDLAGVEDEGARTLIAKLLTKTASARLQSANELAAALDGLLGADAPPPSMRALPVAISAPAPVPSVQGFATTAPDLGTAPVRRRWLLPATVAAALAIGAIGFVAFTSGGPAPVVAAPAASTAPPAPEPPASVAVEPPAIESAEPPAPSATPATSAAPARQVRRPVRGKGRRGGAFDKLFR